MSQNLPAVSAMMSGIITTDQNDPAIKLFGRTIENSAFVYESPPSAFSKIAGNSVPESAADAIGAGSCRHNSLHHHGSSLQSSNGSADVEKPITRVVDIPSSSVHAQDEGHDDVAHGNSEDHTHSHASDKALKRPDKPVPCPRCKSLDTKFCYYNNYNVNQPRHFCKHCQRYWTAGGSLRNLPVGAGRRKNKLTEVLHQRRFPTDGMAVRGDPPDHAQQVLASAGVVSPLALNKHINMRPPSCSQYFLPLEAGSLSRADNPSSSTVLSFKHESSLCGSTYASLHQHRAEVFQGYAQEPHGQERLHPKVEAGPLAYVNAPVDMGGNKACDGNPSQEQIPFRTATGIGHEVSHQPIGKPVSTYVGTPESQMPISTDLKPASATFNDMPNHDAAHGWGPGTPFPFMGSPWQYAGNTAWANSLTATALATALQGPWGPYSNTICANPSQTAAVCVNQPPWSAALGAFWAGFPWPLMQSPLWGPPGAWTMPWTPAAAAATAAAAAIAAAATAANANTAGNPMLASPATGKREREQAQPADSGKQGSLLVPKLLRIDDPGEAVRSSIWATLGIDKRSDSLGSGGIFGAFQPKAGSKEGNNTHAQAWYSNPAALTRSSAFQEGATQNVNVHGE